MTGRLIASALLAALMGALLSEYGWRGKKAFSALCALLLICAVIPEAAKMMGAVGKIVDATEVGEVGAAAVKVIGTGYVFGITSDICTELGEGGVARACGVVCRIEIFLIVLPYFLEILDAAVGLLK